MMTKQSVQSLLAVSVLLLVTADPVQSQVIDYVACDHTITSCQCDPDADVCEFNFQVSYLQTFTRYRVTPEGRIDELDGYIYNIDDNGTIVAFQPNQTCDLPGCTEAATVDGKTFRPYITVNSHIPGPTLIVTFNQVIVVNVKNTLRAQGITIHWHGMYQRNTPWMDGTGHISQCPITPGTSFRYIFRAAPSGTFWYHAHIQSQRTDGLFGALIIRERDNGNADYLDQPEQHTIILQDWWRQPFQSMFALQHSVFEMFYPADVSELPQMPRDMYNISIGPDETDLGTIPFFSGLINGMGRHRDVPLERSKLMTFEVQRGKRYRFRLVGGQSLYAYKVSIAQHKLTVIAADGFFIQPVEQVDYIIIHSGERYDFVLNADQPVGNYWIRAETLEIDRTSNGGSPPFDSLNNTAEAVLHYTGAPTPVGRNYVNVTSEPPTCTSSNQCRAFNCPFMDFHESYNIMCTRLCDLRLLNATPTEELPANNPDEGQQYFLNFGYERDGIPDNINGRNLQLPPSALQTQSNDLDLDSLLCPSEPYTCGDGCKCLHVLSLPFDRTVRLVLANIGRETHPIHLHGHSFFVVATGYGQYDSATGFLVRSTNALSCRADENDFNNVDEQMCTTLHWRTGNEPNVQVDAFTLRKDTVIVPGGGYIVIQFISDNPGYWFLHCHIEPHQMEGMAMVLNIAQERQIPAPSSLGRCGNYNWSLSEFSEREQFNFDANRDSETLYCNCINPTELGLAISFSVIGFIVLVILPCTISIVACYKWGIGRKKTSNNKNAYAMGAPKVPLPVNE